MFINYSLYIDILYISKLNYYTKTNHVILREIQLFLSKYELFYLKENITFNFDDIVLKKSITKTKQNIKIQVFLFEKK